LLKLIPYIDAFNIDLKSFRDDFYRRWTGGSLAPVLETLKIIVQSGKHLEITHLVIPDLNDSAGDFTDMTVWISENLGKDVPLHLSRYFPAFKMDRPPTPAGTLFHFARLASSSLRYVYTGNMGSGGISSTFCPECRNLLISRHGYVISMSGLTAEGKCMQCGEKIPLIL
jgi:pyruvate formate lyase activating enzyme